MLSDCFGVEDCSDDDCFCYVVEEVSFGFGVAVGVEVGGGFGVDFGVLVVLGLLLVGVES